MIKLLTLYGAKAFYAVGMLAASSAIARIWGASGLGEYSVLLTILNTAAVLAVFGADMRYIESAPRTLNIRGGLDERELASRTLLLVLGQSLLVLPFLYVALRLAVPQLASTAVAVVPAALATTVAGVLVSQDRQVTNAILTNFIRPVALLSIVLIAANLGAGFAFSVNAATNVSFWIVVILGVAIVGARSLRMATPLSLLSRSWLSASTVYVFTALYYVLFAQADRLIVLQVMSAADAGFYSAAQNLLNVVTYAANAVSSLILPLTARALAGKMPLSTFQRKARRFSRIVFIFSVACIVLFIFVGPLMLSIFAPGFAEAHLPLVIMSVGVAGGVFFGFPITVLSLSSSRKVVVWAFAVVLTLSLVLSALGTLWFGLIGAAVAAAGSNLLSRAFFHWLCIKHTGISTAVV